MTKHTFGIMICALTAVSSSAVLAQRPDVPVVRLGALDAQFAEPFSQVAGFRELSDGRLLIADQIEQILARIDFETGAYEVLGRQGQGPGEYVMPGALFALPGDTTLMVDGMGRRMLVVGPNGHISSNTIPLRHPSGFPIIARGVDRRGRIYFDLAGLMMPGMEEMGAAGEAPLMRWDPGAGILDTLGYVHFPPMEPVGPGEMRVRLGGGAFEGRDAWSMAPDGRIGIARHEDYHVEWLQPGGRSVAGRPVPYEPVRIGRAEKDAWADAVATRGMRVEVENGRRRVGRPPRPDVDRMEFPEVMPPFPAGAVYASPDGELWVERSRPADQARRTYDVFDASGNRSRQVVLPESRRLLGFGDGVLYVIRTDDDGLEWIERYRL
jgi:hypothetical protein